MLKDGRGCAVWVDQFFACVAGDRSGNRSGSVEPPVQAVLASHELGGAIQRYVVASTIGKPTFECDGVSEMSFDSAEAAQHRWKAA